MLGLKKQSDLGALARNLDSVKVGLGKQVISRSVNKVAGKGRTLARREVAKSGGFKSAYVGDRVTLGKASAKAGNAFEATITGAGRYTTLAQFRPAPGFVNGGRFGRARPWGQLRKYQQAFWIKGVNGAQLPVVRTGKGRNHFKVLYGGSVGRELSREPLDVVQDMLRAELPREASRYAGVQMDKYLSGRQGQLL